MRTGIEDFRWHDLEMNPDTRIFSPQPKAT
jgi:hypothetical protein